ncbi:hypothetical protein BG006_001518 [Podila minutissima]|uniref:Uncharacterized protein n=1 Tax=Podila minutissima TaxID=64525 RepID=A0A9P5SWF5_9FUNG|nr:hypothetical protein BG006_001518 [Podila minutissima]
MALNKKYIIHALCTVTATVATAYCTAISAAISLPAFSVRRSHTCARTKQVIDVGDPDMSITPDQDLHDKKADQRGEHHFGQAEQRQRQDQGPHPPGLEARERRAQDGQPERYAAPAEHQGDLEDEAQWRELVCRDRSGGRMEKEGPQRGQSDDEAEEQTERWRGQVLARAMEQAPGPRAFGMGALELWWHVWQWQNRV